MSPSHYRRPARPAAGLALQPRDRALMQSVFMHRFIRADSLHALHGAGASLRALQVRLRKLWEHRFLDRLALPARFDGERPGLRAPVYTLGRRARLLPMTDPPTGGATPPGAPGQLTLEHHLAMTSFMVALRLAAASLSPPVSVQIEHEHLLWPRLRRSGLRPRDYVVPDGAVCLTLPGDAARWIYVEIVRADVRGGNRRLLDKFRRYVRLHHDGFFRAVFGHERLRAVLVLTTSERRAEHFRRLATRLTHGRQLFWFGAYERRGNDGAIRSTLTAETILAPRWRAVDGAPLSLIATGRASPSAPPIATITSHV